MNSNASTTTTTTSESAAAAINLDKVTKRFGDFTAVDNLTLTVQYGEIFGLLGPNGSGKTTTINMISGLSKSTSGRIRVLGYDMLHEAKSIYAVLGTVPQETALYEELTAWANMSLHADLYGVSRSKRDKSITDMLNLVGLSDRSNSRISTFSGGMKRRLALARALLHEPKLLYFDEPTLGVDVQSRRAIWNYILDLKKNGKTVLLTTNYLEEANALCDRVAIVDKGKLVALDTPFNLKQRYGDTIVDIETRLILSQSLLEKIRMLKGVSKVIQNEQRIKVAISGGAVDDGDEKNGSITGHIITLITQETNLKAITQRDPDLEEIFLSLTGTGLRD
jgi:ABC-2 type transport system ATP-binding protein